MATEILISEALSTAYENVPIDPNELKGFEDTIKKLIKNHRTDESEEHNKSYIQEFLEFFYKKDNGFTVNTKGNIDLVISKENQPLVLIETKAPNQKNEFPSHNNLNVKALQQLLLYYLKEFDRGNKSLRHLCITNGIQWFCFDAQPFHSALVDTNIRKEYKDFSHKKSVLQSTEEFYKNIAQPHIEKKEPSLKYVYVDLSSLENNFEELYRFFSPQHLIKEDFINHGNQLNQDFYDELLHIMGMEEVFEDEDKKSGKKQIKPYGGEPQEEGFLERNTRLRLGTKGLSSAEEKQTALRLCIVWINRILFLKLLEAQLLKYHADEKERYAFLTIENIEDYAHLNQLFFEVLAVKQGERKSTFAKKMAYIPYLNSSLFEQTQDERNYFRITELDDKAEIPYYKKTILKDLHGKRIPPTQPVRTLEYLFAFLEAYDFGSADRQQNTQKPLINAAVLGLIFEKINGYQEGAYFTPGTVTQYMCQEALSKVVLQKFATDHEIYEDLDAIKEDIAKGVITQREAEQKIDEIKICDPSVGSGHFLVSALNQLLEIKYQLGIFSDAEGEYISQHSFILSIQNDELQIRDREGKDFTYHPNHTLSQSIQKALFHQKQKLIEGCLFGVDINPNSVNICRLRLWIELLKSAYYTDGYNKEEVNTLETLPNIDINIKQGDALLNFYHVKTDIPQSKEIFVRYKESVLQYKSETTGSKLQLNEDITLLKQKIQRTLEEIAKKKQEDRTLPLRQRIRAIEEEVKTIGYEFSPNDAKQTAALQKKIDVIDKDFQRFLKDQSQSFEWRYAFPEVLDHQSRFVGFDLVIGNPPYIQLQHNGGALARRYTTKIFRQTGKGDGFITAFETLERTGDIYSLFFEKAAEICRPKGFISLITSNKWMRAAYGKKLRNYLTSQLTPLQLFDLGANVFDSATVDTDILLIQNQRPPMIAHRFAASQITLKSKEIHTAPLSQLFEENEESLPLPQGGELWAILSPMERDIKEKIESKGTPLREWEVEINYGIKTGYNQAFVIDGSKRTEILKGCKTPAEKRRTQQLIRPLLRGRDIQRYEAKRAGKWLIFIPWHFPLHKKAGIQGASKEAEAAFEKDYPTLYQHFLSHKENLSKRNKAETGIRYEWYALQRCANTYHPAFEKEKIVWASVGETYFTYVQEGTLLLDTNYFLVFPENKINMF